MASVGGGVRVEGLAAVVRDLQRLGLDVEDLKDAFAKISSEATAKIQSFVPRKSGRLAGDVRGNRAKSKAVVRVGRSSIPYAGPINYGWPKRGIAAAQYMQKGDAAMQPIAIARLESEIEQAIRKRGLNR